VYWLAAAPLAFGLIAWWYRRRARRLGVSLPWRRVLVVGLGAMIALALLAAAPSEVDSGALEVSGPLGLDWLRGLLTPLVPIALALIVLGWIERSPALAMVGAWIGVVAWWFTAAGLGRIPGWLAYALGGFQGPALGGQLHLFDQPGPTLIVLALPLVGYAVGRGLRARRG
jgi:hypothetical protein